MANLLSDLARIFANPYGNVSQRLTNVVMKHTVDDALKNVSGSKPASARSMNVSSKDARVDKIVNEFNLGSVGDTMKSLGYQKPEGMGFDDASTRAFIKLGEKQGLSLGEIEKLLELNLSNAPEAAPGTDLMRFSFEGVTDELRPIVDKLGNAFTLGNLAAFFPDVEAEQTKAARKQRAAEEASRPTNDKPAASPFDRVFNLLTDVVNPTASLRDELDTLSDTVKKELGEGYQAQFARDRAASPMQRFMESFASFMGVQSTDADLAETNLQAAVNRLTGATVQNTAATNKFTMPLARFGARAFRGAIRAANRLIPQRLQGRFRRAGARIMGGIATRMGMPAGTGAAFGSALGGAAGPLAAFLLIGFAAVKASKYLSDMAGEAYKTTLRLAKLDGGMAVAEARLDTNRFLRDIRMAQMGSEWGATRLRAQDRLENAMAPWKTAAFAVGNMAGTFGSNLATGAINFTNTTFADTAFTFAEWGRQLQSLGDKMGWLGGAADWAGQKLIKWGENGEDFWKGKENIWGDAWAGQPMAEWFNEQVRGKDAMDNLKRLRTEQDANANKPRQPIPRIRPLK